jgi:hypothetical protein
MKNLAIFQTQNKDMLLLQTSWSASLNPVLKNPIANGILIETPLISGSNIINHRLGRKPQGYIVVDQDASATFFRSAPFNELTLALNSSANVDVSLYVF